MRAGQTEYRLRYLLSLLIYLAGLTAPWNYWLHLDPPGPNMHLWGLLASDLVRAGWGSTGAAFDVPLVLAILLALLGAWLRTWGAAYLGAGVVQSGRPQLASGAAGDGIVQEGPYGYVRNPIYLGTLSHSCALALLMSPSGALVMFAMISLQQFRLVRREEQFLSSRAGVAYAAYCAQVRRWVPALRPGGRATAVAKHWTQALLGESYFWGAAVGFAVAGWYYSATLLLQCLLVSLGLALILRALAAKPKPE